MADIKLTMKATSDKKVDNTELVEAIKEMRANFGPETQNKVINLALKATFFVPGVIQNKTELVMGRDNKLRFDDSKPQSVRFLLISNPDRGNFFPAYTDRELLKDFKANQPYQGFAMTFSDLANMSEQTPTVNGFVINPDTEKLPFTKEILDSIKQTIIKAREKAQKLQGDGDKPNIVVSTNEDPEE